MWKLEAFVARGARVSSGSTSHAHIASGSRVSARRRGLVVDLGPDHDVRLAAVARRTP
jgi:hypothetical protein